MAQTEDQQLLQAHEALAARRAHEQDRPEHDLRAQRLAGARRAEPVRSLLAGLADAEAVAAQAREALTGLAGEPDAGLPGGQGGSVAAAPAVVVRRAGDSKRRRGPSR